MLAVAWLRSKWWRGVQCLMHQSVPRSHYDSRLLLKIVSDPTKTYDSFADKTPRHSNNGSTRASYLQVAWYSTNIGFLDRTNGLPI